MKKYSDSEIIQEWQTFIGMFKNIDHTQVGCEQQYTALKTMVKNSAKLTPRQTEMLIYRCDNYKEYHAPKPINSQEKQK